MVAASPEVVMEVFIASIGIVLTLVLILTVMNRRARRTGHRVGLDESGIVDARYHNDTRAQQQ
jgi:hypothetical protein